MSEVTFESELSPLQTMIDLTKDYGPVIERVLTKFDEDGEVTESIKELVNWSYTHPQKLARLFENMNIFYSSEWNASYFMEKICEKSNQGLALYYLTCNQEFNDPEEIDFFVDNFGSFEDYSKIKKEVRGWASECADCNSWELDDYINTTTDDTNICRNCCENHYTYSDYYSSYIHEDSVTRGIDRNGRRVIISTQDDNFNYCEDREIYVHYEYTGGDENYILASYHSSKHKYVPIHSEWTRINKRFFGVELEVEVNNNDRSKAVADVNKEINGDKLGSKAYFENDSSLSYGFEIITQPMGLDGHHELWKWVNTDARKALLSHKTSSCGLHVHVSNDNISKLQTSKMITFVNAIDNQKLISAVARRYASGYARIEGKKLSTAYKSQAHRHEAINLNNSSTIEFRIFKGTLKYESIMAAIQFVNALILYCHDQSGYGFDLSTNSFLNFIKRPDMIEDARYLNTYLETKLKLNHIEG
jgi:hypothetical protein